MRTINSLTFTAALFLSLIFIQSEMNAQTNSKYWKQYHYFIGFGAGPSQTKITNQSADNMYQPEAIIIVLFYFFETGYFFPKILGVTTGIGFSPTKPYYPLTIIQILAQLIRRRTL